MRWLLLVAAAALLVAPAVSARTTSPCALVTADDAGKALGVKVGKGKAKTLGLFKSCTYTKGRKTMTLLVRQIDEGDVREERQEEPAARVPDPGHRRRGLTRPVAAPRCSSGSRAPSSPSASPA